jgi:hypothetical protein
MHQHHIRLPLSKDTLHAMKHVARNVTQGLVGFHQVKIEIRLNGKQLQHLIQHLPVLGRDADFGVKRGIFGQSFHNRGHFNGFGTGAEHTEDFHQQFPIFQD